jgi:hypothetical protein
VTIRKYEITTPGHSPSADSALEQGEIAVVTITKINDTPLYKPLSQTIIYDPNNPLFPNTLELVPGEYKLSGTYFDEEGFTIQKDCKHICEGPGCLLVDEKLPKENIEVKPSLMGGISLDNETGYWSVSVGDLDSNKDLEIYVLKLPTPTCIDKDCELSVCIGMEEIGKTQEYSEQFSYMLKPRFV